MFTPSILTILGVIMYLRLPWVVGSVGLTRTIVIVSLSVAITLLTGLSISALATNMRVGRGGAYYMISRTLGLEVGAAVGLPLFLAQALGIAFYIAGFTEIAIGLFADYTPLAIGITTLAVLAVISYFSADLALRSQYLILAILAASLASLFLGGQPAGEAAGAPIPAVPFWATFAVFFPAVTGIESGLSLSGDLKKPSRALPLGTLLAVAVGYAIYLAIPAFVAYQIEDERVLLDDSLVLMRMARWPELVVLGILGASLSSAMGAMLGSPRTLQSLARDGVLPRILGRGYGRNQDPRIATLLSFGIAVAGIMLGDLNAIAPVLSMFFLTSYAVLNLSAGLQALIGGPAWRPSFNVPWWVSLTGFLACLAAMLMINAGATFVALAVSALVYHSVRSRKLKARWGDVRYGALVLLARLTLEAMAKRRPDARSWNPNVLVLSGTPSSRWHLVVVARALAGDTGFLTVATVITEANVEEGDRVHAIRRAIEQHLETHRIPALVKVATDDNVPDGLIALVKSYGFGPLIPNTVLLGKAEAPENPLKHAELLAVIQRRRRSLVVLHEGDNLPSLERARRIDIWWDGDRANFGLMLALAFLLKQQETWASADIVVGRVVDEEDDTPPTTAQLEKLLAEARFPAQVRVVCCVGDVFEVVREHSGDADIIFLGLRAHEGEESLAEYAEYYSTLARQTEGLPPTAFVCAGKELDLHRLFASR